MNRYTVPFKFYVDVNVEQEKITKQEVIKLASQQFVKELTDIFKDQGVEVSANCAIAIHDVVDMMAPVFLSSVRKVT